MKKCLLSFSDAFQVLNICKRALLSTNVCRRARLSANIFQGEYATKSPNVTFTEMSIIFDELRMTESKDVMMSVLLSTRDELKNTKFSDVSHDDNKVNSNIIPNASKDKGTSNTFDILEEMIAMEGNWEGQLNVFRRNIALRANRVLHPARNAQIFSALLNTMISDGEWEFATSVVEYVGLTPSSYVSIHPSHRKDVFALIDLETIATYVSRRMLELDLERLAWLRRGREGVEPSTPRSRGESVQEWLYTQVHRSDLGFRVCDMVLAVLRLSLRYTVHTRDKERNNPTLNTSPGRILIRLAVHPLLQDAGVPVDEAFISRCQIALTADLKLLPMSSLLDSSLVDIVTER